MMGDKPLKPKHVESIADSYLSSIFSQSEKTEIHFSNFVRGSAMNYSHNHNLISKVLVVGIFIAALIYLLHPDIGQLSVIINGKLVADPVSRFAAVPTMLLALAISLFLGLLLFFGVGLFIFFGALCFAVFGMVILAPYFWPVLLIIFLVIALESINSANHRKT